MVFPEVCKEVVDGVIVVFTTIAAKILDVFTVVYLHNSQSIGVLGLQVPVVVIKRNLCHVLPDLPLCLYIPINDVVWYE